VAVLRGVGDRPVPAVLVGAVAIAFSGILFRLSHVSASTGAFYRCVFALPPLWLLARLETRRFGRRGRRAVALALLAGAFFAADLVLWHNGIEQVGAGLATVLGNTQVVMVGLLAWAILGERPHRSSLTAIPIVGVGVLLISGVLESGAYGKNPGLGVLYGITTAIAYSGFLLALREGSRDLRRPAGPLFTATPSGAP
jgi:drug/metabolite transporter (DMT)-like permease